MQTRQASKKLKDLFVKFKSAGNNLNQRINADGLLELKAINAKVEKVAEEAEKNGYTYLHAAVAAGDKDAIEYLLTEVKVDVNAKDSQQKTALQILIEQMKNEREIWNPLKIATNNSQKMKAIFQLKKMGKDHRLGTWQSSFNNLQKNVLVTLLLKNGAKLSKETEIENNDSEFFLSNASALNINVTECEKTFARKTCSLLHTAAINNDLSVLTSELVAHPTDINKPDHAGYTPLHYALEENHSEEFCLYLRSNLSSPPVLTPYTITVKMHKGKILAYKSDQPHLIQELSLTAELKTLAFPHASLPKNKGVIYKRSTNPTLVSNVVLQCGYDYSDIVKQLIANGADVNAVTKFGETPLLMAVKNKSLASLKALLATGKITSVGINAKNVNAYDFYTMNTRPDVKVGAYNNAYLFIKESTKLYYVSHRSAKEIQINDIEKFKQLIAEIIGDDTHKCLDNEQFEKLITSNADHVHAEAKTALDLMHEAIKKASLQNIAEEWKCIIDLLLRHGASPSGEQSKVFLTIGIDVAKAKAEFQLNVDSRLRSEEVRNNAIIADQKEQRRLTGELVAAVDGDFRRHESIIKEQTNLMIGMEQELVQQRKEIEYLKSENESFKMLKHTPRLVSQPQPAKLRQSRSLLLDSSNTFFIQPKEETISIPRNKWKELKREMVSLKDEVSSLKKRVKQLEGNQEKLVSTHNQMRTSPLKKVI